MSTDPSDEHHKLVFAHAGAALYHAQVFEEALSCFILAISVSKKEVPSTAAFDSLEGVLKAKTLGGLLKHAQKYLRVSAEAEKLIDAALDHRNHLAHHFFKDYAEAWFSDAGRNRMIAKLKEYEASFETVAHVVGDLAKKILARFGVTEEMLAHRMVAMKKNA